MEFSTVAATFSKLEEITGRLEMTRQLATLFEKATPEEIEILTHLSLGELHAPYQGSQLQLAEKSILSLIATFLNTPIEQIAKEAKKSGDLGSLLENYSWKTNKRLSVQDVYNALCAIEKISGTGSQKERGDAFIELISQLNPESAKYVTRIVIGKLRLGFSDMTIIDALSWMITGDKSIRDRWEDAYNRCSDIGLIAYNAKKFGIKAASQTNIIIGIPIRPAGAERLPTAAAIFKKIGSCVAQPKLDGFRLQIHIDTTQKKPVLKFFSRNLLDMSQMFPDLAEPLLKLKNTTCIMEGEAIGYDLNTNSFLPFQETVKRKRKHEIETAVQEFPLRLFLFDLLYINGESVMEKTHEERRADLSRLIDTVSSDLISVVDEKKINSAAELEGYFLETVEIGLEGLVVKRPDALYQPGKRNFNWIKLKRQEEGHLEDTIDCVILGYYRGKGKRASFGIGAFLVGVFNKKLDQFETIAKIGTGLKDEEWKDLRKKCDALALSQKPNNVMVAKELIPDVWVNPEIICLIRADEITVSPVHTAGKGQTTSGYALRFPRFMGYREDKSAYDASEIAEIKQMYQDQYAR